MRARAYAGPCSLGAVKKGRASWSDWVLVGHALEKARAIAMRNAGTPAPIGGGLCLRF